MDITDLKTGEGAEVAALELPADLCERLKMLGVYTGAYVRLLKIAPMRAGFLLSAGAIRVAVGKSVAVKIIVRRTL